MCCSLSVVFGFVGLLNAVVVVDVVLSIEFGFVGFVEDFASVDAELTTTVLVLLTKFENVKSSLLLLTIFSWVAVWMVQM